MQHPFEALRPEYEALLARMQITRASEVDHVARQLVGNKPRYAEVSEKTGIPIAFIATSFEREASSDFRRSPAQGDFWNRVSTHVPSGRGPFPSWTAAALDAYHLDRLDAVGAANWTWARACYEGELFNGFGYRAHGVHSPYLWSGSNDYTAGKFTSDHGFDPGVKDQQLGIVPVMKRMIELDASLAFAGLPEVAPAVVPLAPPQPAPIGVHDAAALQTALNTLGASPRLIVDDNYGRATRRAVAAFQEAAALHVDGIAGPETWAAIDSKLTQPARTS